MNKVKMPARKYFIAIVIPPPFFEKIESVKEQLFERHHLKGALRSPAHITLHRPFEWKEEKENKLVETLKQFDHTSSFEIEMNGFACFEPRVIYVNVLQSEKLDLLQRNLTLLAKKQLQLFNQFEDERGFHPHITVANRDLKKQKFYELWPEFQSKEFKGTFDYKGFSLLRLEKKWEEIYFFDRTK
jgi:2'-5' RNA ligase